MFKTFAEDKRTSSGNRLLMLSTLKTFFLVQSERK